VLLRRMFVAGVGGHVGIMTIKAVGCDARINGRHQQEVRSTGKLHLERRYDCVCWFCTVSAYIWFQILWRELQLVEDELRRKWQQVNVLIRSDTQCDSIWTLL